ncbi:MAG: hypothetical protein M1839_004881 [Geoglossum umbratile]|nr:MAG: hypothetical protein M1839_004881 [Geoglossum umbratile]
MGDNYRISRPIYDTTEKLQPREPRQIVIVGGGIIGCTTAYYLTRHPKYDPEIHKITLVEGTRIAGAASGKAGGFLASWAYPSCIVPLSFSLHEQLARDHGGEQRWGYRRVRCGQLTATGRELRREGGGEVGQDKGREDRTWISLGKREAALKRSREEIVTTLPEDMDWLVPETVDTFEDISDIDCMAQVQPYLFTNCMAKPAEERGVRIVLGSVEDINYKEDAHTAEDMAPPCRSPPAIRSFLGRVVTFVTYRDITTSVTCMIPASTIVLATGPWTPNLFPWAPISALRAHSITIKPRKPLSSYCVFTEISFHSNNTNETTSLDSSSSISSSARTRTICPEILTRPNNEVCVCGHGDYNVPLPPAADEVEASAQHCQELIDAAAQIAGELDW